MAKDLPLFPLVWLLLWAESLLKFRAGDCRYPCGDMGGRGIQGRGGQPLPVGQHVDIVFFAQLRQLLLLLLLLDALLFHPL
jgi:hypothetical protein